MKICRLPHRIWFPRRVVTSTLSLGRDAMDLPRHWREPSHVFTMPAPAHDLFSLPDQFIDEVFTVMNTVGRHEFQVATRHIGRVRELAPRLGWAANIWLGVIVEDESAVEELALLSQIPAQVRFAHVQPKGTLPAFDVAGLNFVFVESSGEPTGLVPLQEACAGTGTRLFLGPRAADAELRAGPPSPTLPMAQRHGGRV